MVGPKGRGSRALRKPMAADIVRKLVNYWNGAGGVNSPACPRCGKSNSLLKKLSVIPNRP
jgi:hypothetical protein